MVHLAREQLAYLTLRGRLSRLRQIPPRHRWVKYAGGALKVLRNGPGALRPAPPPNDFDYRGALEVTCRYRQPGHDVPMHLFVSDDNAAEVETDLLGWDKFHQGPLMVDRLAGDHHSLLEPPEVEQLARMMLKSLHKPRASATVQRSHRLG
jgi:hypothetical protein